MYTNTAEAAHLERKPLRGEIAAIKDVVLIEDYLQAEGVEVKRSRARCIVHGGENPTSFSITPETRLWFCFSCGKGGDIIDLCKEIEGHAEARWAVVSLATRFGVNLPGRPERWHSWQEEKAKRRRLAQNALTRAYQRRYFKLLGSYLEAIEDPEERREEARSFWDDLYPLAYLSAKCRMSS